MDPNRDSHQAQTGRISFEDWMRITTACAARQESSLPAQATQHERRLMTTPLLPILATLFLAAAAVIAILLWQ
jgi:hypothetical protein